MLDNWHNPVILFLSSFYQLQLCSPCCDTTNRALECREEEMFWQVTSVLFIKPEITSLSQRALIDVTSSERDKISLLFRVCFGYFPGRRRYSRKMKEEIGRDGKSPGGNGSGIRAIWSPQMVTARLRHKTKGILIRLQFYDDGKVVHVGVKNAAVISNNLERSAKCKWKQAVDL